jgi:caa(3)-type oxidase subunit IV
MHSDPEAVRKQVRTYMMVGAALFVFTGITVAVNQIHLAVPLAITVALIIATMKGSMVASIFMHLSHEKKWIYGALLLTVLGFLILMTVPIFTTMDTIGQHVPAIGGAAAAEHPGH